MLNDPTFCADEANSPLILRTFEGFPLEHIPDVARRVQSWVDLLPGAREISIDRNEVSFLVPDGMLRSFWQEAERTFIAKDNPEVQARSEERQKQQVEHLKLIYSKISDYHQELGAVVAFLQLFVPIEDLAKIVLAMHQSPIHAAGYFQSEPQSFISDANVLKRLLMEDQPSVAEHLAKFGALTEMYSTNWFIGLAVYVLPVRELLDYWEAYFQYGFEFVYSFGLEFIREFSPELLAENTTNGLMAILLMADPQTEGKFPPQLKQGLADRFASLLARAVEAVGRDALGGPKRLHEMRHVEAATVARRAEEARKRLQELEEEDDGIMFSDEED